MNCVSRRWGLHKALESIAETTEFIISDNPAAAGKSLRETIHLKAGDNTTTRYNINNMNIKKLEIAEKV